MQLMTRFVKATDKFYPDFVRLFAELGLDDPIPQLERWNEEWAPNTIFLMDGEAVVGYAMASSKSEPAHLIHVAVDPRSRRRGSGRALMLHMAERLRNAGRNTWYLNVRVDNWPAIRLYESLGFKTTSCMVVFRVDTAAMKRLPVASRAIHIREVDPADDRIIETQLGLPSGKISENRSRTTGMNLGLHDTSAPENNAIGYGWFAPSFPGVYPLRLARPNLLHALLEHIFPLKTSPRPFIQVVVEDDQELVQILRDAGAVVYLDANHMEAAL